ncbi:winged helix-turn-helix domain-containing protein [Candidatus Pelagibacter sp.]|nr:winged helix-turn-helix domain-containing protein [Candidatus Pelagibacter sp.]
MNSKKIIIFDYDILFNILDEIKGNLNFDIISCNQNNLNTILDKLEKDFLIISKKKEKNLKNNLIIENNPLSINKLIEIININFLKIQFNFQSEISIGNYKLDLNSREISKNKSILDLTERETNLIMFLKNSPKPVKINELQKEVWRYSSELETHTVETHIYRLRKKIKDKFDDDNFIISLPNGYMIN